MPTNELPSNMGKKIADALKKQSRNASAKEGVTSGIEGNFNSMSLGQLDEQNFSSKNKADIESPYDDLDLYDTPDTNEAEKSSEDYAPIFKMDSGDVVENPDFALNLDTEEDDDEFEMPNNINVLKRLIAQLPNGVSKQTGAQIIRQTIEALGIPMKSVLQDAQRVKDVLNSSIKDCNFTIQEYKSNIRNLEKQNSNYQKQLSKLNDIIGLFVYTEK